MSRPARFRPDLFAHDRRILSLIAKERGVTLARVDDDDIDRAMDRLRKRLVDLFK